jgi:histidinol-phosphate aminotransferase
MLVLPGERQAARLVEELLGQGVITRPLKAFGLPRCVRISTGTEEDNRRCVEAMERTWPRINTNAHQ